MMEIASTNYLAELGMEVPSFHEYPMDCFAYTFDEVELQSLSGSPECYNSSSYDPYNNFNSETKPNNCFPDENLDQSFAPPRPTKKLKTLASTSASPPSSQLISFENSNAPSSSSVASKKFYNLKINSQIKKAKVENNIDYAALVSEGVVYEDKINFFNYDDNRAYKAASTGRNPVQAKEHVMAERKRREKLSQRFVALSAMVPGLKKMDKDSILGDAIKYVKELQERVQSLEEKASKNNKRVESAVIVKRSFILVDDEYDDSSISSSSSSHGCDHYSSSLPEIQARVCGKEVLIRIHCDKHSGCEAAILRQLEKHHLTVHTTTSLPFGNDTLDITLVAQMKEEYCTMAKDLLGSLRLALSQLS